MRCAYFDCFSGVAGDMVLGALVDAGLPTDVLHDTLTRLALPGVRIKAEKTQRGGLAGTHVSVVLETQAGHHHRHLPQITEIIDRANLPTRPTKWAHSVFQRLAEAEASVHGIEVNRVHFHEVGAEDAIVDIVAACVGLDHLGIDRVVCSPIPTGHGTVRCAHGELPVPAPATAALLRGVPLATCDEPGELTTPTGAALMTTLAEAFGPLPAISIDAIGYGAGTRENRARPNLLRLIVGEQAESTPTESDEVVVLETQLDDASGQVVGHTVDRLLTAGALDAFVTPILMKKGRPGHLLTVLCPHRAVDALTDLIFAETTTFGVRRQTLHRTVLERAHQTVETRFGSVRVKVGTRAGHIVQAWPEYEDCAEAARRADVPLRDVQDAALSDWKQQYQPPSRR